MKFLKKKPKEVFDRPKKKKKYDKLTLSAMIVSGIAVLGLICLCVGLGVIIVMMSDKPKLNLSDFETQESSIIYDQDENIVAELGLTIRQNIAYEDLPNCVVDAFVAVEDSRFFKHSGFDIPRFTKAILENIRSMSFSQGGSTFTMQLVKNTYFVDDATGEEAASTGTSGVRRKVQEIATAIGLENMVSKKVIFEQYVNKLNFGGDRNIRGIEKASEYYFSKPINEVNYIEAAMLAGVVNAPNYYNPFYNIEAANSRKDDVIYLMHKHGYITDAQYQLGLNTKIEDLLVDPDSKSVKNKSGKASDAIPYQAYIDAVVDEVYELTGLDPYSTTMHIYTYMNPYIQSVMDDIEVGNVDDFEFPDDYFECASIAVNNANSGIVGILGGRNYATGGQMLLNHATSQSRQTGSSIKPILDYSLAFENLGWATSHVITDKPLFYEGTELMIGNSDGQYRGDVTLYQALGDSINTCAIQTLQAVIDAKGKAYCVDYLQSIGFDTTLESFDIQNAIGGYNMMASVKQMAGAYSTFINLGKYTEPHCVKKVVFTNGKSPITVSVPTVQVLSEAASYMTLDLLYSNVQNYGGSYDVVKDSYPVYAKTGTTTWEEEGKNYGIPFGSRKDSWLCAATSAYTVSTWTGYDKASQDGKATYITEDTFYKRIQARITNHILDATVEHCKETPKKIEAPTTGITTIRHIIGTWPYASIIDGMDEQYITTGYIKKDNAKLVTLTAKVEDMSDDFDISVSDSGEISIKWPEYPDKDAVGSDHKKDISLKKADGTYAYQGKGKQIFNIAWVYGSVVYKANIEVTDNSGNKIYDKDIATEDRHYTGSIPLNKGNNTVKVTLYYGFTDAPLNSNSESWSKKITIDSHATVPSYSSLDDYKNWFSSNGLSCTTDIDSHTVENPDKAEKYITVTDSSGNDVKGKSIDTLAGGTYKVVLHEWNYVEQEIQTKTYYCETCNQNYELPEGTNKCPECDSELTLATEA